MNECFHVAPLENSKLDFKWENQYIINTCLSRKQVFVNMCAYRNVPIVDDGLWCANKMSCYDYSELYV